MANPTTEPTRLRGDPTTIVLADGTEVGLVFDFDALCEIEETFGTLNAFTHRLAAGSASKICNTVAAGVTAALRHLEPAPDLNAVRKMLDGRRSNDYIDALEEAFVAGMPPKRAGAKAPKATGETDGSPGMISTTSGPLSSVAATASSGT